MTSRDRRATYFVPLGIATALAVTMISYAGLHHLIFTRTTGQLADLLRPESVRPADASTGVPPGAFWRGSEHYHGDDVGKAPGAAATPRRQGRQKSARPHRKS